MTTNKPHFMLLTFLVMAGINSWTLRCPAQELSSTRSASATVPQWVHFSGVVKEASGRPVAGITFAFYKDQEGGAPIWMETQNVQLDETGRYSVQLGATRTEGLPKELFASGEARWLGIRPDGQPEQSRVMLMSVPYALKAGDAETVGGLPPSAFALAVPPNSGATTESATADGIAPATVGGSGTINFIPIWTSSTALGNSILFQTGGNVGIGNTSPASKLDVMGGAIIRGALKLFPTGVATSASGVDSQPLDALAEAFNSSTLAPVIQHFRLQAEPAGNDTSTPSGTLNLLFGSGTSALAETGLSISNKGLFTFAAGQTFPGAGTIAGITTAAGSGLTGGVTTGSATLSLIKTCSSGQTLAWNGTAWVCASSSGTGTITGVTAGVGLSGGGTSGTVTLSVAAKACASGQAMTALPFTCAAFATTGANTFTANQTVKGDVTLSGALGANDGTFTGNVTANGLTAASAVSGATATFSGAVATGALGVTGNITAAGNITATGATSLISGVKGMFSASNATQVLSVTQSGTGGGILVTSTSGEAIVGKSPTAGIGVVGDSTGVDGIGVLGSSNGTGGVGVQGISTGARGVQGNSDVLGGVVGVSTSGDGIGGVACSSCSGPSAVFGTGKLAGAFSGNVGVTGDLSVTGVKAFHIDHPLDPANKYLNHFAIESNEVLNTYSGNVTTDSTGTATVNLPDYFQALNSDYRYQLTIVGQFAQAIILKEIENNSFIIKTDKPSVKVSWQVTGVRSDAFVKTYPVPVEEDKLAQERGYYLAPELVGQPEERSISWLYHGDFMRDAKKVEEKLKQQAAARR